MTTTRLAIAPLLALLAGTAAADPDLVIASHDEHALAITQLSGGKATELYREAFLSLPDSTNTGAIAYGFTDAHTLWVLRSDHGAYTLARIVDGKAQPAGPVAAKPAANVPSGYGLGLMVTRSGQAYVARCSSMKPIGGNRMQCVNVYERLDDGSLAPARKRPADARFELGATPAPALKAAKAAPAGYRIALVKHKAKDGTLTGFTCKGPNSSLDWPEKDALAEDVRFTPSANKFTWYATTPPVAKVSADVTTPVGEHVHADIWLADCQVISGIATLPGGLWIGGDKIYAADGSVLGTAPGSDPDVAP